MADSATQIREDLDQLVRSAGWLRFTEHVRKEWGTVEDGGGAMFLKATRDAVAAADPQRRRSRLAVDVNFGWHR